MPQSFRGAPPFIARFDNSAGVTICHVNVSRWGNPPSRGRFMTKAQKRNMYVQNFVHFPAVSWQKSPETATDTQGV